MKRQAGRPSKENCSQLGNDFGKKSSEVLAEQVGQSKNQIFRYIRLTELIPEMLDMVDEKKIAFNPAYELSFLKKEEQRDLLGRDGQRTGHAVALSGPAAEKVQPGGPPDPRHDARHHGGRKEKRPGQDHLHQRHPAQVFSKELHPRPDAGDHHQAAGTVAAQAPATARTLRKEPPMRDISARELKGHNILAVERFRDNTRWMIEFSVLRPGSYGSPGDEMRLFLTEDSYQAALLSQQRREIKIKKCAHVIEGHVLYVKKKRRKRDVQRKRNL